MDSFIVRPYFWKEEDLDVFNEKNLVLKCWAMDQNSSPYLIKIKGYYKECYIQLPIYQNHKNILWDKTLALGAVNNIIETNDLFGVSSLEYITNKKLLYYYSPNTVKLVRIRFHSLVAFYKFKNSLKKPINIPLFGNITFKILESEISCVRKFLSVRNLGYASWMTFSGIRDTSRISTLENEFSIEFDKINPLDKSKAEVLTNNPGILSFDIETYSDNHRRMPESSNPLHKAYMLCAIFQRYKQPETRRRFGILIGECKEIEEHELDNCKVYHVSTELKLVEKFRDIILECDPEIITGYNIFKYDYPYLDLRLTRLTNNWPNMSRLLEYESAIESSIWSSSAYGTQDIFFLKMEGRFSMDLYPIIQREYTRLPKYNLDTVSMYFLGKKKHPIEASEMFKIYENISEAKKNFEEDPNTTNEIQFEKSKADMTRVLRYCIQDSELVTDLIDKLNIWDSLVQMSDVVGVPILDLYTKGQQARCLSKIYDEAYKNDYVLNFEENSILSYKGGSVSEPIKGLHDNVVCLDFKSLYPSAMIAYNICYTTLIRGNAIYPRMKEGDYKADENLIDYTRFDFIDNPEGDPEEDPEEENFIETEENKKIPKKSNPKRIVARFVTKKVKKGLLPTLVQNLIDERNKVRRGIRENSEKLEEAKLIEETRVNIEVFLEKKINKFNFESSYKIFEENKTELNKKILIISFIISGLTGTLDNKVDEETFIETFLEEDIHDFSREKCIEIVHRFYLELENNKEKNISNIKLYQFLIMSGDKKQNAIKVSTNSFYGFLGVQNGGKLPLLVGAACITHIGRTVINDVNNYFSNHEEIKATIIYGDTDSTMFTSNLIKTAKDCDYYGRYFAQLINGVEKGKKDVDGKISEGIKPMFRKPLEVEFEKAMRILNIRKKKYAALFIENDGSFRKDLFYDGEGNKQEKYDVLKKGIAIARRDNCQFFRDTYEECLLLILLKEPLLKVLSVVFNSLHRLITNQVNYKELVITMGIKDSYKSESNMLNIFRNYLNEIGIQVGSGDRLDFVIVEESSRKESLKETKETLVGYKMRLKEQIDKDPSKYRMDHEYYIEKKLSNPLNQLIEVGYKHDIEMSREILYFKRTPRCNKQYLDVPVIYYVNLLKEMNHDKIINFFTKNLEGLYYLRNVINRDRLKIGKDLLDFIKPEDMLSFNETLKLMMK